MDTRKHQSGDLEARQPPARQAWERPAVQRLGTDGAMIASPLNSSDMYSKS